MSEEESYSTEREYPRSGELRRMLHQLLTEQRETNRRLRRMESKMADLQTSLTDLQTAVDAAVSELGGNVAALQAALDQAQADLAAAQGQEAADETTIADLQGKLTQSVSDAQAAAEDIEAQVSKLNEATGTTPSA